METPIFRLKENRKEYNRLNFEMLCCHGTQGEKAKFIIAMFRRRKSGASSFSDFLVFFT